MFTKNWYKATASFMCNSSVENFKNMNNEERPTGFSTYYNRIGVNTDASDCPSLYKMRTSTTVHGGVIIGTGTTPPTMDDYNLSGDIITTFTYSSDVTKTPTDNGFTFTALYTITNTGGSAFTIGEIGLFAHISNAATSSGGSAYRGLLERTVLDTPVTIEPGGIGQVTYTITFTYPTA